MDNPPHVHMRERLELELRKVVPDVIWHDLVEEGFVDDASDVDGWRNLEKQARRYLRHVGAGDDTPRRRPAAARKPILEARGRAWNAWVARSLRETLEVRATWGGPFSREDAIERLRSYAWCLVPLDVLRDKPGQERLTVGDAARIRDSVARVIDRRPETRAGVSGIRLDVELRQLAERREVTIWRSERGSTVTVDVPGADPVRTVAANDTFVSMLVGLAEQLRNPWTRSQTLWFILTDEAPEPSPLSFRVRTELGPEFLPVQMYTRDVISLEVEPWVPAAAVTAAYREAQKACAGPKASMGQRSVERARFLATEGWGLSIREQTRAWTGLHGAKRHPRGGQDDPGNFRQESLRAERLLLGEPFPIAASAGRGRQRPR